MFSTTLAAYYVGLAHVTGGLLLAAGILTRIAALIQIPALFAATFFVHLPGSLLTADQSFAFSALVLALLVVFAIWGGGRWSLDHAVDRWARTREATESQLAQTRLREIRARDRARRERAPERPARGPALPAPTCQCDREAANPGVEIQREYGAISRLRFVFGTHPRPSRVTISCRDCGGVVENLTPPEATERYRFLRPADA